MKILTKGIYYFKPTRKAKYLEQIPGLTDEVLAEYINEDFIGIWHDCEKLSRRPGTNRVQLKHKGSDEAKSNYECAHCGFKYELDRAMALNLSH